MDENIQISKRIKELVKNTGLPNASIAHKLDISPTTLSQIKTGKRKATPAQLISIARHFGVSLDYVMLGKEYEQKISTRDRGLNHLDSVALQLGYRIERQSHLMSYVSQMVEKEISHVIKKSTKKFKDKLIKSSSCVLLDQEILDLETFSDSTRLGMPYIDAAIKRDTRIRPSDYQRFQKVNLKENKNAHYTEIYSKHVADGDISAYRELIIKDCGPASSLRVKLYKVSVPIITQFVLYDLDIKKLQQKHMMLFRYIEKYLVDVNKLACVMAPQYEPNINVIADENHYWFMNEYYDLLKKNVVEFK